MVKGNRRFVYEDSHFQTIVIFECRARYEQLVHYETVVLARWIKASEHLSSHHLIRREQIRLRQQYYHVDIRIDLMEHYC